jgi:two-component system, probable response regulator PhcQ
MSPTARLIFVVDDDELILKSLSRMLRRPGFEVASFSNADAALARLSDAPDLIVCDYHLPKVDGLSVAAQAKRALPRARTLLLSGAVEDDAVSDALRTKVVDRFLAKPWRQDELLSLVDALLAE